MAPDWVIFAAPIYYILTEHIYVQFYISLL